MAEGVPNWRCWKSPTRKRWWTRLCWRRADLQRIAQAVKSIGMQYRHMAGVDMLVDAAAPKARSAVHLIFVREKVRPEYTESVPGISEPTRTAEGILIAPVADLVRMKLTSFHLKDQVHIQDMDSVGLKRVRASE